MQSNDLNDNSENSVRGGFFARYGKKITLGALCFILALVTFCAGWLTSYFTQSKRTRSLAFFLNNYDNYYLETREGAGGDVTKILADALLDKYSEYYTAEEYAAENKASYGEKRGLGITFLTDFSVYSVSGNSPAERAGIKEGGRVIAYKTSADESLIDVNSENANAALNEFISKLSDSEGEVTLKIEYDGEAPVLYTLEKSEYTESYVYYADAGGYYGFIGDSELELTLMPHKAALFELDENVAYIKLTQFNGLSSGSAGAAGQIKAALDTFKSNNKSELILDLRSNGGGFMSILCDIASYFCDYDGGSALCQKAIDKYGDEQLFNMQKSKYKNYGFKKIVILANENSASASEALIGAMLDYDKASGNNAVSVILSPHDLNGGVEYATYGKGIMQSTYINPLTGEAVKLTTAKIYWPISGVCIHGTGVTDVLREKGFNVISGTNGDISAAVEYLKSEKKLYS